MSPSHSTNAASETKSASIHFMTLDPGHFHAALLHKEMYADVAPVVDIYAPLGPDLLEHLKRLALFNTRVTDPTAWQLDIHTGPDPLARLLKAPPGNVAVLSGKNRAKIDQITALIGAGLNVLADKPWIIRRDDFPKLEAVLHAAASRGLVAYDIMTERYEVTTEMQRELVNDPAVFGQSLPGSPEEPAVYMRSVHHIMKLVAGVPNRRPVWFFDINEQGEALGDVGTHLVDLAQWTLFPHQIINYATDIDVFAAKRWPTILSRDDFEHVTGCKDFPAELAPWVTGGRLHFYANTGVDYRIRGIHVKLDVLWNYASADHGDTHQAVYRGSRARVDIHQGKEENYRPETYVAPNAEADRAGVLAALRERVNTLQSRWPGLAVEDQGARFHLVIPDRFRVGHEAHFGQVTRHFLDYLRDPHSLPAWENAAMLAKYYVTTRGTELSLQNP